MACTTPRETEAKGSLGECLKYPIYSTFEITALIPAFFLSCLCKFPPRQLARIASDSEDTVWLSWNSLHSTPTSVQVHESPGSLRQHPAKRRCFVCHLKSKVLLTAPAPAYNLKWPGGQWKELAHNDSNATNPSPFNIQASFYPFRYLGIQRGWR